MTIDLAADLQIAAAILGNVSPIASAVLGDLGALAAGAPVTIPPTPIKAGKTGTIIVSGTAKLSSAQDVTNPSVITLLGDLFADASGLLAKQPVTLPTFSDKIGNSYLDLSFTLQVGA
jgi:hypothetical protein